MTEFEYKPSPCVGSGLCCKTGPCGFGKWNEDKHQCDYLEVAHTEASFEVYRCGRYEYIKDQPFADIMPAFGAGCCMSLFNTARNTIIKEINNGNRKVIDILFKQE